MKKLIVLSALAATALLGTSTAVVLGVQNNEKTLGAEISVSPTVTPTTTPLPTFTVTPTPTVRYIPPVVTNTPIPTSSPTGTPSEENVYAEPQKERHCEKIGEGRYRCTGGSGNLKICNGDNCNTHTSSEGHSQIQIDQNETSFSEGSSSQVKINTR